MAFGTSYAGGIVGKTTAAAGTAWYALIPSYTPTYGFTCLLDVNLTNGNTATNITLMRPIGSTTAAAAASTGVNTITLSADPGNNAGGLYPTGAGTATNNNIAANDIIVTRNSDGTETQYTVGAYNATTKVATVSAAALAVNVASGAKVWWFGINTDTDPMSNAAHPIIPNSTAVNATGTVFNTVGNGFRGSYVGDPLLIYCGNATNAIVMNYAEYTYDNGR